MTSMTGTSPRRLPTSSDLSISQDGVVGTQDELFVFEQSAIVAWGGSRKTLQVAIDDSNKDKSRGDDAQPLRQRFFWKEATERRPIKLRASQTRQTGRSSASVGGRTA